MTGKCFCERGTESLLTYSMVWSPSWEANWFAASQEIPRISRNPKVHYRTHKRPPPVSILGQPNPVHIPTSHLLEINPNIHPSTPRSPQWSLSLRFPHQDPIQPPLLTHTRHMPSPSHSSRFYHPHNIGEDYKSFSSSLCNLLHSPVTKNYLLFPEIFIGFLKNCQRDMFNCKLVGRMWVDLCNYFQQPLPGIIIITVFHFLLTSISEKM